MLITALVAIAGVAFGLQALAAQPSTAAPTLTINQANGQADPTKLGSIVFTAAFSKPVTGFTSADVTVSGTAGGVKSVAISGSGPVYTVTVNGASGNGTVTATIGARTVQDLAGKLNAVPSTSTDNTVTLDTVAPAIPAITVRPASLSTSTSASFSFTDAESGVTFRCRIDGSAMSACSPPRSYSSLGQGGHTFGVQALDAAGNLSGSATYSWSIDSIAPTAPVLTQKPSNPTPSAINTFAWTAEAGATFQCGLENGSWFACSTPYTYVISTSNNEQHQFRVRARDGAGNASGDTLYTYKFRSASAVPFPISGNLSGLLTPGTALPLELSLTNPNSGSLSVTALSVTLQSLTRTAYAVSHNQPCGLGDYAVTPYNGLYPLVVPGSSTRNLSQLGVPSTQWPKVTMLNTSLNQDGCKGATMTLSYTGSGQGN